jgi:hypothetical protein
MSLNYTVLIPCYKPDSNLITLVKDLSLEKFRRIVLVNDGSGDSYKVIFEECAKIENVDIVRHATNLGKGRSIKTGLNHIMNSYPDCKGVITADADGQHHLYDIIASARELASKDIDLVMGSRSFDVKTPLKSKFGNSLTSFIFRFFVGLKVRDTQTGLRGLSHRILTDLMRVSGERYEYETNMLLEAKNRNWSISEITIQTIYIDNNKASHFNPIMDSMRIYFLIFRFFFSSISSSAFDFSLFSIFIKLEIPLLGAIIGARLVSGWLNFFLNKNIVFHSNTKIIISLIRYWSLVLVMGLLSYSMMYLLKDVFLNVFALKLGVESVLFLASFAIQKEFVFAKSSRNLGIPRA